MVSLGTQLGMDLLDRDQSLVDGLLEVLVLEGIVETERQTWATQRSASLPGLVAAYIRAGRSRSRSRLSSRMRRPNPTVESAASSTTKSSALVSTAEP
jgi:hypothetical protein